MIKSKTKVKQTANSSRIWIEGKKLIGAGFLPNTCYTIKYNKKSIVLTLDQNGTRKVTGSVRNGNPRPIIDLHSKLNADVFAVGDVLTVTYVTGKITFKQEQ